MDQTIRTIDLRVYCSEGGRPEHYLKRFDRQTVFGSILAIQYIRPRIIKPKSEYAVLGFTDDLFLASLNDFSKNNRSTNEITFFDNLKEMIAGYNYGFNLALEITKEISGMTRFYKIVGVDLTADNLKEYFETIVELVPPVLNSLKLPTDLVLTVMAEINIAQQTIETIRCQDGESLDIYLYDDAQGHWLKEEN